MTDYLRRFALEQTRRANIAIGLVLILLGIWFLAFQLFPEIRAWLGIQATWPLLIVAVGIVFLVGAIAGNAAGLLVPACIFAGIGVLLYWQNMTGNWESWAYAWTLIPGFVGIGLLLMGLMERRRSKLAAATWLILFSLILFGIFGTFLGGQNILQPYWPVLLIALGVVLLSRSIWRAR